MASLKCVGQMRDTKCSFKWIMRDICVGSMKAGESIVSPKFAVFAGQQIYELQLMMYFRGQETGYVSLYLKNITNRPFIGNCKVSILDDKNEAVHHMIIKGSVIDSENMRDFVKRDFLLDHMGAKHKLTIFCIIVEDEDFTPLPIQDPYNDVNLIERLEVLDDYEKLFEGEEFSDVTFKVDGEEFRAHKCIMSKGSSVFKAMFEHNMKENQINIVEIQDVQSNVFKELLRFVYSGKVIRIQEIAEDLLAAADKYSLAALKVLCEISLCKDFNTGNVIQRFRLSDLHGADILRAQAIQYIVRNRGKVADESSYKDFIKSRHPLAYEILEAFMRKRRFY